MTVPVCDSAVDGSTTEVQMPKMLVGTFHKTGTILMFSVVRQIARRCGYRLSSLDDRPPIDGWDLYFDAHSLFDTGPLPETARGVVVIRDPRDVIISGAHYHARLEPGPPERWAHIPNPAFGGLTYREKIGSLPTEEAQIAFEMENFGARTLDTMKRFITPPPGFINIRFEELVSDPDMAEFRRMFDWLGIRGQNHRIALHVAEAYSLFKGNVNSKHVRSGRPEQWRQEFTPALHDRFRQKFGTLAEDLGYPPG